MSLRVAWGRDLNPFREKETREGIDSLDEKEESPPQDIVTLSTSKRLTDWGGRPSSGKETS